MKIRIKEYVIFVKGRVIGFNDELDASNFIRFVNNIVSKLPINASKCKEVNVEIYKADEKTKVDEINLASSKLEILLIVDRYNKILKFNGIDCVSEGIDEEVKKAVQTEWRKLLIVLYDNEKDITRVLTERKENKINETIKDYDSQIEDLYTV